MTKAACPVRRGPHGPKTVTAGNKNTVGRMPSALYLSINIDSEVCPGSLDSYSHKNKVIQYESAALQGSHYKSTNQKLLNLLMLLKLKLIFHSLMSAPYVQRPVP